MGLLHIVFAVSIYSINSFGQELSFVEKCIGDTQVLKSTLSCFVKSAADDSSLVLNLIKGEKLLLQSTGSFGKANREASVQRIQHLGPRITDFGAIKESLRFVGTQNDLIVTLNIQCHQTDKAIIGVGTPSQPEVLTEYSAFCWLH